MAVKPRSAGSAMEVHPPDADWNAEISKNKFTATRAPKRTEAKPKIAPQDERNNPKDDECVGFHLVTSVT
jgi:hypothetical protein